MAEQVLRQYAFFRNGPAELQDDFLASAKRISDQQEGEVFQAGDKAKRVYLVGEGALNVYVSSYSGRDVTLYNVWPGEMCPINLGAVLSGDTAIASAKAKSSFNGAVIAAADFRRILGAHSDFRHFVIGCLATKFESVVRQISEITTRSVDARLERYFDDHADDFDEHGFLAATNEQIGTQIGASREVVNRKLRAMQKAGLVELERGRIRLLKAHETLIPKQS